MIFWCDVVHTWGTWREVNNNLDQVPVDQVASCFTTAISAIATPSISLVSETSDIINCVTIYCEKESSGNNFLRKEKFRKVLLKKGKMVKKIRETVTKVTQWSLVVVVVLLIIFSHLIVISQCR